VALLESPVLIDNFGSVDDYWLLGWFIIYERFRVRIFAVIGEAAPHFGQTRSRTVVEL